jgi:hypothetical protein
MKSSIYIVRYSGGLPDIEWQYNHHGELGHGHSPQTCMMALIILYK